MPSIYLINLPHDCGDDELREWVESRGVSIRSLKIIRDVVANASPSFAFVQLRDNSKLQQACDLLNGGRMRNRIIQASPTVHEGTPHEKAS